MLLGKTGLVYVCLSLKSQLVLTCCQWYVDSHTLYTVLCLCFDWFVQRLTSSKTVVDLNEDGMLLMNSLLVKLESQRHSGET